MIPVRRGEESLKVASQKGWDGLPGSDWSTLAQPGLWLAAEARHPGQAITAGDGRKRILEIALLRRALPDGVALMLLNIAASCFPFTFLTMCKYLYYFIFVDILYKLPLIWIIERSVSFPKSAFEEKGKDQIRLVKVETQEPV